MNRLAILATSRAFAVSTLVLTAVFLTFGGASAQTWLREIPYGLEPGFRAPGYVPNEALVQLRGPVTRERAEAIAREEGATLAEMVTPDGLIKIRWDATARGMVEETARWRQRSDVLHAAPNLYTRAFFVPNDTTIAKFDLGWNLRQFDAFSAWDVVTGSPDVVLAIVDAGVAYEDHPIPDYERRFVKPGVTMYRQSPELPGPFLPGWDFVHDDAHPNDDYGHGTSVATIAAGAANNTAGSAGIAFGVTILPVKVLDYRGDGTLDNIIQGIRFAADQGADVINLSLGLFPIGIFHPASDVVHALRPLRESVQYAQRLGSVVVAAAGNFGVDEVSYPAAYPGVIAIGATGVDDRIATYSSYGTHLDFMAPGGDFLEVNGDHVQDGVAVLSIKPHRSEGSLANPDSFDVFFFFGTSAAAPHVSGAVALLMSLGLESQGEIEQTLRASTVNQFQASSGFDREYGFGLIQLGRAVRNAVGGGRKDGGTGGSAAAGEGPLHARLLSANPARGETGLEFETSRTGPVRARVYDARGALVRTLHDGVENGGVLRVRWDGRTDGGAEATSGVYFLRVETVDGASTRKVAFLR